MPHLRRFLLHLCDNLRSAYRCFGCFRHCFMSCRGQASIFPCKWLCGCYFNAQWLYPTMPISLLRDRGCLALISGAVWLQCVLLQSSARMVCQLTCAVQGVVAACGGRFCWSHLIVGRQNLQVLPPFASVGLLTRAEIEIESSSDVANPSYYLFSHWPGFQWSGRLADETVESEWFHALRSVYLGVLCVRHQPQIILLVELKLCDQVQRCARIVLFNCSSWLLVWWWCPLLSNVFDSHTSNHSCKALGNALSPSSVCACVDIP